ncbi:MAG: GIY-YIG nuclease family protein [Myxococcales bacterium]|nr:GIY-YIG nuclease family protein [Myxococcales bacterium]
MEPQPGEWWLYVLLADSGRTYVGITLDLARRLAEHNGERPGGARATRAHRPWRVGATYGPFPDRSQASRAEHALKKRRGAARLTWAPEHSPSA